MFGGWKTTQTEYISATRRYAAEIGRMQWAAPQDWMCEPWLLAKTGLDVLEHQKLTIKSVAGLRKECPEISWVPVLQGWRLNDYARHVEMYFDIGINLLEEPTVGLGSVCRRQATSEIKEIVEMLSSAGIALHGFGVKMAGVKSYGKFLHSCDSLAWSFGARRRSGPCPFSENRKNCSNCAHYAIAWRNDLITKIQKLQIDNDSN
jgi:hypothetical protein